MPLLRSLLREARHMSDYNFRSYAIRRVKVGFAANAHLLEGRWVGRVYVCMYCIPRLTVSCDDVYNEPILTGWFRLTTINISLHLKYLSHPLFRFIKYHIIRTRNTAHTHESSVTMPSQQYEREKNSWQYWNVKHWSVTFIPVGRVWWKISERASSDNRLDSDVVSTHSSNRTG